MRTSVNIVIPNWNGLDSIEACLTSLQEQSYQGHIIVVDNGSIDGSKELIKSNYPDVELIELDKNYGFDGGVNAGILRSFEQKADYIALFNNDAAAHFDWLKHLVEHLESDKSIGIAAPKLVDSEEKFFDSTGDLYTTWGLPFPRGRGEPVSAIYDDKTLVFGATAGATLYRTEMLQRIGIFDYDFFAYYEDVDISWRAQLAGWKVAYVPNSIAYHQISATSSKMKGFATYQTMKNLPLVFWKNVPWQMMPTIGPRFKLAYFSFFVSATQRGQFWYALKGFGHMLLLFPKKLWERRGIQRSRTVSLDYIRSLLVYDLPPNAHKLRTVRATWWRLKGKKT